MLLRSFSLAVHPSLKPRVPGKIFPGGILALGVMISMGLSAALLSASEPDESYVPTTIVEEENWALGKGIIIRGAQREIGEVIAIRRAEETDSLVPRAKISRSETEPGRVFSQLNVGDIILTGDTVSTEPGAVMEILLGLNARLRLEPGTRLRMVEMDARKTLKGVITHRRMELLSGGIRARVRENTVTPSPILFAMDKVEITVGLEQFAVPGGIDVFINYGSVGQERDVAVYNGTVEIFRPAYLSRKMERIFLTSGSRLLIPEQKVPFSTPLTLASPYFEAEEIEDWPLLLKHLRACGEELKSEHPACGYVESNLWLGLGEALQQEISRLAGTPGNEDLNPVINQEAGFRQRFLARLNWLLEQRPLGAARPKQSEDSKADNSAGGVYQAKMVLPAPEISLRNRLLLESTFPGIIKPMEGDNQRVAAAIRRLQMASAFSNEDWRRRAAPPPLQEEMLSGP
ncbi:MAG: hypothetical protein JXA52_07495 [Planctomycetes bacterium]|nr:hypothetical protein [Planctomycetota bacterium]